MKTVNRQTSEIRKSPAECSEPGCAVGQNNPDSEHGGNIYKIARKLGIAEDKLIDFSASINPLGISENVKEVIRRELDGLVHYPDPDSTELTDTIASHHDIDADTIICGNGSTELIYLIPRVLRPRNVLITAPAFSEYEKACALSNGLRVESYELDETQGFRIDPDMFIERMLGCHMAFLCNPNNPTGLLLSKNDVLKIAGAADNAQCHLVVDEAFIDFAPDESVIGEVKDNPYLIVLRSMTKFYALTGVRVGYGVFHKELIPKVKEFKEPWTVNNLAQKTAVTALEDSSYADATYRIMIEEKAYMEKWFNEMGIKYYPSAANYYLLKINQAGSIALRLRQKGLLVRDCSNFKGLGSSYIRVAVKSHQQNEMLIKEMNEICRA
jgi:threonine-phosphate decarboxylase